MVGADVVGGAGVGAGVSTDVSAGVGAGVVDTGVGGKGSIVDHFDSFLYAHIPLLVDRSIERRARQ